MPPVDDIPPIAVVPVPPTLDAALAEVPFVPLADDELDAVVEAPALVLDEPEVVLDGPDAVLAAPVVVLATVIPPALPSVGAASPLSVPHPARNRLDKKSATADRLRLMRTWPGHAAPVTSAK